MAPPEVEAEYERQRERAALAASFMSSSPSGPESEGEDGEDSTHEQAKEADQNRNHVVGASHAADGGEDAESSRNGSERATPSATSSPNTRIRAQSTYGAPQGYNNAFQSNSSLGLNDAGSNSKHRVRSQSTDFRHGPGLGARSYDGMSTSTTMTMTSATTTASSSSGKFVDPLVLRRQEKWDKGEKEKELKALIGPGKKVPVGQLVAFFDSERM